MKPRVLVPLSLLVLGAIALCNGRARAVLGDYARLDFYTGKLLPSQQNGGSLVAGSNVTISRLTGTGTGTKTSTWTATATAASINNTDTATISSTVPSATIAADPSSFAITTGTSTVTTSSASVFSSPKVSLVSVYDTQISTYGTTGTKFLTNQDPRWQAPTIGIASASGYFTTGTATDTTTSVELGSTPVIHVTGAGLAGVGASRTALDANDRAVFYFNEAAGSTTFANSGNAAGDLTVYSSTVCLPKAVGLQGQTSLQVGATCQVRSATSKWEYSNFTIHYWVFLVGPTTGNLYVIFKNYNTVNTYTDPYFSINTNFTYGGGFTKAVSSTVYVQPTSPALPATGMLPVGVWTHVALTWDGQYLIYYVNGIEVAKSADMTGSSVLYGNHGEWSIGMRPGGTGNGVFLLQDLRICDVARSASYLLNVARMGHTYQPYNVIFGT